MNSFFRICMISLTILMITPMVIVDKTNVSAIPGFTPTEYLIPNRDFSSELHIADGNLNSYYTAVTGDPGSATETFWSTNNSYLYWGNLSSKYDEYGDRGVGRAIFSLSEPMGISDTGYWQLSVTGWSSFITFPSDWVDIDAVQTCDAPDEYHGWNLGVGYTSSNGGGDLLYSQTHTGYWGIDATASYEVPTFKRPETGTQYWDVGNNTNANRAWSTAELYNLVIIVDLKLENEIFDYQLTMYAPCALAIAGLSVAIAPSPWEPQYGVESEGVFISAYLYYLVIFGVLLSMSFASSYNIRRKEFNLLMFIGAFSIGFAILVWMEVFALFTIIIPILLIAFIWFRDRGVIHTEGG